MVGEGAIIRITGVITNAGELIGAERDPEARRGAGAAAVNE